MGSIRHFRELDVYRMAMELEMAVRCAYLDATEAARLEQEYEHILGKLATMLSHPEQWTIRSVREEEAGYDTSTE